MYTCPATKKNLSPSFLIKIIIKNHDRYKYEITFFICFNPYIIILNQSRINHKFKCTELNARFEFIIEEDLTLNSYINKYYLNKRYYFFHNKIFNSSWYQNIFALSKILFSSLPPLICWWLLFLCLIIFLLLLPTNLLIYNRMWTTPLPIGLFYFTIV